ncbi:hypothetical protein MMC09_003498 [Bachmanniomyces sp. S44760]|nr:hypothetical protein [Bachmanniomyces sp. S44760]
MSARTASIIPVPKPPSHKLKSYPPIPTPSKAVQDIIDGVNNYRPHQHYTTASMYSSNYFQGSQEAHVQERQGHMTAADLVAWDEDWMRMGGNSTAHRSKGKKADVHPFLSSRFL